MLFEVVTCHSRIAWIRHQLPAYAFVVEVSAITLAVKQGGRFGLAACLAQIPLLVVGAVGVESRAANDLLFGFVEMVTTLTISGLTLYLYARAGAMMTRDTRPVIWGAIAGLVAGTITGVFPPRLGCILAMECTHSLSSARLFASTSLPTSCASHQGYRNLSLRLCSGRCSICCARRTIWARSSNAK